MKTFTLLYVLLFSLFATTYTVAQTKDNQNTLFQSTYNKSKLLVQSQDYSFVGYMVYDSNTREQLATDSSTVTLSKTNISGTLATLTSKNKTINLNGSIEDYKVSFDNEKQRISIQFNVKSDSQTLEVNIEVKPNANVFLEVKNDNSSASYVGKLKKLK